MKNKKKLKQLKISSIGFSCIGILFLIIENIFYQKVDTSGVLHESMFLPLGTLFLFVGVLGFLGWLGFSVLFAPKK